MTHPLPSGVASRTFETPRLATHALVAGDESGVPILFIHGNVSSARFWDVTLAALPAGFRGIAPDLRGFGGSAPLAVDATRGLGDWADDLHNLMETMGLATATAAGGRKAHLVGWSMGGGIALRLAMDHADMIASLTLIAPLSPFGFGGTKDVAGARCWPDAAGSGGGTVNPEFLKRLAARDRGADDPASPRNVMNTFYVKPPFRVAPEREDAYVDAMLTTVTGEGNYPGEVAPSPNWPAVAPGARGVNNAMAPTYCDLAAFASIQPRPPVLWVRGADDQIVSDTSLFDLGYLGQIGAVPGWPGAEVYPPQPMIAQTRAVFEAYRAKGGAYREVVLADCGHSPHIEKPEEFRRAFFAFLGEQSGGAA